MQSEMWVRATKIVVAAALVVAVLGILFSLLGGGGNRWERKMSKYQSGVTGGQEMMRSREGWSGAGGATPMMGAPIANDSAPANMKALDSSLAEDVQNAPQEEGSVPSMDKKVIKNGDLTLRVENAEWSVKEITRIAKDAGGDVFSSNLSDNGTGVKSGVATVKVPFNTFDETLGKIKSLARATLNESTSGQDVTMEYVDLQARLKAKQAEEEAFASILSRQTDKVQDVLAVTRELARVRGEIEQLQAQMKYLESQTDMATITVFLSEDAQLGKTATWRPWQVVKDAFNTLIRNAQGLVDFLIRLVIVALPILLIVFAIFGTFVWWVAKKVNQWWKKSRE